MEEFEGKACTGTDRTRTARVWHIAALNEAGVWKDRTIVEDMDLAVRARLKGWNLSISEISRYS